MTRSLHGKDLEQGNELQLISRGIDITSPCANATISVGDEAANVRIILIQLTDASGKNIDYVEEVDVNVYLDAARVAPVVTGGSTGIADGGAGYLSTVTAKKKFVCTSNNAGLIDLDWTDTGTEVAFLGVKLPSGRFVMSSSLANAS